MPNTLARNWWLLVIRGLAAILFGVLTFLWPGITLLVLVFLFAGYALVGGVADIAASIRHMERQERWGWLLLEGIAGIAAAVITVFWPAITAFALVYVIAFWAILTGVFEIGAAIRLRKEIEGEWLLALAGIVSVVFGVLIAAVPRAGALAIALWVGAYALVFGVLMVVLGFRLRARRFGPSPLPPFGFPTQRPVPH